MKYEAGNPLLASTIERGTVLPLLCRRLGGAARKGCAPFCFTVKGESMNRCLLFLVAVAALLVSAPAYSQYFFLDSNGDGLNHMSGIGLPIDVLNSSVTSVDVYVITDKNRDGSTAICSSAEPFTINQYEFTLHTTGSGSVTFNSWTDNMGFTFGLTLCGDGSFCTGGGDVWVAKGSGSQ